MAQNSRYNYLQNSFDKQLQRSYDRNQRLSPPSLNSPSLRSPANDNRKQRSVPRSSEFSPYENKEENIKDKILVQQLKNHNRILTQQVEEYKNMVDKLQIELRLRTEEFASLDMLRQKERVLNEETICEMKEEIGILLTKNSYLEQKNIVLGKQLKKFEIQNSKNQARARSLSTVVASSKETSAKLIQQITNILQTGVKSKKKQRQTGKVLNQTFSNIPTPTHSPRNAVIFPNNLQNSILDQIQSIIRRLQKYQELTESIIEMQYKITGKKLSNEPQQLKLIWKWLKQLGHNYNITQRWKKMLMDVLGLSKKYNPDDMSVDDVLQKTIVELHSK